MKAKSKNKQSRSILSIIKNARKYQILAFVLVFAVVGSYLLWRSFASNGILLTAANYDQSESMDASLIRDSLGPKKAPTSVVQVPNDAKNHRYAVFMSSTTVLDPGTYSVCLIGRAPTGATGGSLSAVASGSGFGSNSPAVIWSLPTASKYGLANGCIKNLILTDAQTMLMVTVDNSLSGGSTLNIYGIAITRTGSAPKQANHPTTIKSGNWSDPTVWDGGHVPGPNDKAIIANNIKYDEATTTVAGVYINTGANLTFDPAKSATLQSSANVIVEGVLHMHPGSPAIKQTLRFVNVNESKYVGGGMVPLDTDVGLWVMDNGQLDLVGSAKTGWTRASGSIAKGATSVTLNPAPVGWQPGDTITIAPSEAPTIGDASWNGFDEANLTGVKTNTVSFTTATARPHPMVNNTWTAEVADLTRNVMIEGTTSGRAHIFVRSNRPQTVNYVAIRYMGPRQVTPGAKGLDAAPHSVLGRYGLHFHMSGDGTRGSTVTGTVVRDAGAHAFVPHSSNGITFTDTVSYNTYDEAYWYDGAPNTRTPGSATDDTVFDHAMAAKVQFDPPVRGSRLAGFVLGDGLRNLIKNSVAVGVQGTGDSSGFEWPEGAGKGQNGGNGIWTFNQGNIAHNNKNDGIFTWQNVSTPHTVSNFVGYYNGTYGISHGAYANSYTYSDSILYGNGKGGFEANASSCACGEHNVLHLDRLTIDGGGVSQTGIFSSDHNTAGDIHKNPTYVDSPVFKNLANAFVFADSPQKQLNVPDAFKVINPNLNGVNLVVFAPSHKSDTLWVESIAGSTTTAYAASPQVSGSNNTSSTFVKTWNGFKTTIPPFL